ncbi:HNH endonuclease signature motif containing protein [Rhizobium ecuadorense]|uniref:HNH endonuclease signature motif containing protein n=1 Tax=Rhizobium ecuadorense TaxID=1671795 RepID=UPI0006737746|nr:HNH endonuclease signature motif containing protein [Rhizobium ecuadorense]
MAELTFAEISKLLKYEPETGKLFWLPRPVEMFSDACLGGSTTNAKRWNNQFANKEAFLTVDGKGYLCGNIFDRQYGAARVAWLLHSGDWPKDCIDHINGDPKDNRITNLRDVSRLENQRNRKRFSSNKSGVCGVIRDKKRWKAHITVDGRLRSLGVYDDISDAIAARLRAEKEFGYHPNHGRG